MFQCTQLALGQTDRTNALIVNLANLDKAADRSANFARLKNLVRDFVIGEINRHPRISDADLRAKLTDVLPEMPWADDDLSPYVFSSADKHVRAVVYFVWFGFHGIGGTGIVIDSYVTENGKTRLAGRGGGELSGHILTAEHVSSSPSSIKLLGHGRLTGSNGVGTWRAAVYNVDRQGVHTLWQTMLLGGMEAHSDGNRIIVQYIDRDRYVRWPRIQPYMIREMWHIDERPRLLSRTYHEEQ